MAPVMNKVFSHHSQKKSLVSVGLLFLVISVVIVKVIPNARLLPDLALILTLYCALTYEGEAGIILPLFAGAYVGSFSSFPVEYMGLYGTLYYGSRFISSFFQLRFVGYPMLLAFVLEWFVGAIHMLEIYLKQPAVFSPHLILTIILVQSALTALFLYPIFLVFDHFSWPSSPFKHALK